MTPARAETPDAKVNPPAQKLVCENLERGTFKAQVGNYLRSGEFDTLERLAHTLIKDDPRYACGVSKLVDFYAVLEPSDDGGIDGIDSRVATFTAWEKAKPDSYLPKAGFAMAEEWRAYKARGTKRAKDVTPEQWEGHARHMKLAEQWAGKALAYDPGDPQLFTYMVGLCRALSCPPERFAKLLASALAINPRYDAVYVPMANSLVPRWLGSSDAFVDFAEQAADDNKALGNIVYARIATVALLIDLDKYRATYPRFSWDRIQDGFRQIEKRYPGSTRTSHLLARFAYVYEDRAVAREALLRLKSGWRADVNYWGTSTEFLKAYRWALDEDPDPF
jgi:hypothetical protein